MLTQLSPILFFLRPGKIGVSNPPLRAEVYGIDRLQDHAREIAHTAHVLTGIHHGKPLMARLRENAERLNQAQRHFATALQNERTIPLGAEWLLDNYYIIETQLNQVSHDLSAKYYRELPKLAGGPLAGYPRVYYIALELISHTDSHLNQDAVERFVRAFQQVTPLSTGELWAVAIMLRIVLIENLRRLIDEAEQVLAHRADAENRANQLLGAAKRSESEFLVALGELASRVPELHAPFVVHLMQQLRDQDPIIAPAIQWLERRMQQANVTLEEYIRAEHHHRAVNRVSIGNAITSMRLLGVIDWHAFFEKVSLVERILRQDPDGTYPEMDFASRDRYRHIVETLAKYSASDEAAVASRAVAFAREATRSAVGNAPNRRQHIGYYLIDEGLTQVQKAVQYSPPLEQRAAAAVRGHPTAFYLSLIALLTALLVAVTVAYASGPGVSLALQFLVILVTLIPMSVLTVGWVNWTLTVALEPVPPPKLELAEGIPPKYRTMVVVPALLTTLSGLEYLLEHLELRYLANRDTNLHFAILGDFADAPQENMPEDATLIAAARQSIEALNAKYERTDAFYFFHRRRQWNAGERCWMGWERKRGKLDEFNRLLRGAQDTGYIVQVGSAYILPHVKYVITLDADTELPMQVARRLVGAIAHPLNRAVADPGAPRIVYGYGIIQPRVDVISSAAERSRFAKLFTGDTGLDPYSSVVSNVYQDFFGRGVYIGKAIYDVDAAHAVLEGTFPDNLLLSHDLLEGAYMRTGFASDVELLEDFPSGLDAHAQRQHRWARGDWQITAWLFPRVRDCAGNWRVNPLPLIERWKIFDNLRRSLVPLAVILLLIAGWTVLPGSPLFWTLLGVLAVTFPFIRSALSALGERAHDESLTSYLNATLSEFWIALQRAFFTITVLLFNALLNADAIVRVGIRRAITHRNLLEWTSHAAAEHGRAQSLRDYLARMWSASVLALLLGIALAWLKPEALWQVLPLLLLWLFAPTIAYALSEPERQTQKPLSPATMRELRMNARRIWRFYQDLVGEQDHWLPPDNFQLEPKPVIAHRTSPTNIAFFLLSILAAFDLGYIRLEELVERVERVFETLSRLDRYRGHLYNWYDTRTLQPLNPQYVSTVDSGNLAASLIVLKQTCLELCRAPGDIQRVLQGARDTLSILETLLGGAKADAPQTLKTDVARLRTILDAARADTSAHHFDALERAVTKLERDANAPSAPDTRFVELHSWCRAFAEQLRDPERLQEPINASLVGRLEQIAERAQATAAEMEFGFLYDETRNIFAIGFNATNNRPDDSYYDLLASEARLTSFLVLARGEVPERHWFHLNRPLAHLHGKALLLSWGGTMFEYLMPPLFLRDYTPSLLQRTQTGIVREQIAYASKHQIPWGISESGFYVFDYQFNYQYRAFGVPALGLKREIVENRVIAPYATFLALQYAPHAATRNLEALARWGAGGIYGMYEALDFTPSRLSRGQRVAVVRSYMAHHQGMSLAALDNFLNGDILRERFHREPMIAAAELLLQERVPRHAPLLKATKEEKPVLRGTHGVTPLHSRHYSTPHTAAPRAQLLSNGEYTIMLTNAGSGYSAVQDIRVTRWQEDPTRDALGTYCYIRDRANGDVWSNTYQPVCAPPDKYHVVFASDKVEFVRRDGDIETKTEIFVSPEWNAEVRHITLTNHGKRARSLELTSYSEVVLDVARDDAMHPTFSKLFIESEFVRRRKLLLLRRRPRAAEQRTHWVVHSLFSETPGVTVREYETDRAKFIGRGRTLADPLALYGNLSNTTGAVLDPVMSLRTTVDLVPAGSVTVSFITGVADTRREILALCDEYLDARDLERAAELARARSEIEAGHLGITADEANLFQRFASRVFFPEPELRAPAELTARNTKGQTALWAYGISGDYPIVLLRIDHQDALNLVRKALLAHEYWRLHNLRVDLVIVEEQPTSYASDLDNALQATVQTSLSRTWLDTPGGIFVRRRDHMSREDFDLLQTVARVILRGNLGDLGDQIHLSSQVVSTIGVQTPRKSPARAAPALPPKDNLQFFNGLGGFDAERREYVIALAGEEWTPAPWTNVLANPDFGCLVSEAGLGCTWAINSQQNRLTPWSNDPVSDVPAEILYLQDLTTNAVWSSTPLPVRETEPYTIRHGSGYSVFEHTSHGIAQTLHISVSADEPVKLVRLTLRNTGNRISRLSVTYYVEWVLGTLRAEEQLFVLTELDAASSALFARNVYSAEFHERVTFAACAQPITAWTAQRAEFIGRNGSTAMPAALTPTAKPIAARAGMGLDPCAVLQTRVELQPGDEQTLVYLLGQGDDAAHARALIQKYRTGENAVHAAAQVQEQWHKLLDTVRVQTPDAAFDTMINHWLIYQTLACRLWARSAFYQSGGAYGFRDQLQDVTALVFAAPEIAREHILRAAAHQFPEGDVLHWWHTNTNTGVRTRISDDYLWLPYAVVSYVKATGDGQILDEPVPFVNMPLLETDQTEIYGAAQVSSNTATLYEHCLRALEHGLRFGAHGLPLMGTGDWNDGMNRVGVQGKGESVWLGWFLYTNLVAFSCISDAHSDMEHAHKFRAEANALQSALNETAWDGAWYRRAYFDDGTSLGSQENAECKIDAIAQAWSVISNAAPPERAAQALRAVDEHLVRAHDNMILLLAPPFEHSQPNPGYIQGYVAGIRENGGQYTHSALWVILAQVLQGNGDRAHEMFRMLNPLNHASTREQMLKYKVEPYVVAADVYAHPQHMGRGGWTWYTGSAAWMYRIGVEYILGFQRRGDSFCIEPCIPRGWKNFHVTLTRNKTHYEIEVENPNGVNRGVARVELDGTPLPEHRLPLLQDGNVHHVRVVLGSAV